MKKIYVKILYNDRYGDFKENDIGYINGYVQGGDNIPYIVVVFKHRISLVQIGGVRVIKHKILTNLINFFKKT